MNTFFRQKLTNKTIDLLEKVEDKKAREEEEEDCLVVDAPTVYAIIGLPTLIILGIILPILAIQEGEYLWGIIGIIMFGGMGGWLSGFALFWKVIINHEKVEFHSSIFGIGRSYPLKDITKVCYDEVKSLKIYKGNHRVFRVYSGTYGSDDLVQWFAEEGIVVEDHTPKEECYKVMPHPVHTWELMGLNIFIVIPGNICVLYLMYRDFHLESVKDIVVTVGIIVCMIGFSIAIFIGCCYEAFYYLKYQNEEYSYYLPFHKEKKFELDEKITYKADENVITVYRNRKKLFEVYHASENIEFFGSTLLEKDIQCIQGEKYMEKYRKKDVEEEI